MIDEKILQKLFSAFSKSMINGQLEFVADKNPRVNTYFSLRGLNTELEVQCKVLEWLSRAAFKNEPYYRECDNNRVHLYHLNGINYFLNTNFTMNDIEIIYQKLGNGINQDLTRKFVDGGFDINTLEETK